MVIAHYGRHMNTDNFGKRMRATMMEQGLEEYTTHEEWIDSYDITRVKHSGYVGPSCKSLRSFGATYLVGENVDIKAAQAHFGHRQSSSTVSRSALPMSRRGPGSDPFLASFPRKRPQRREKARTFMPLASCLLAAPAGFARAEAARD